MKTNIYYMMVGLLIFTFSINASGQRNDNGQRQYGQRPINQSIKPNSVRQPSESQVTTERTQSKSKGKNRGVSEKTKTVDNYTVGTGDVELVVTGEGYSQSEAVQKALRSAIEQAYGVFVSSNTSILNDEVVKDEIATVSSGNIKAYKELGSVKLPDGKTSITLSAIVTISKLVSYVQSHGGSAEFAGQTFLMNMKMRELNIENEKKVIENACRELRSISHVLYDYSLLLGEPKKAVFGYYLPLCVVITPNENYQSWMNKFNNTLSAISMSDSENAQWEDNDMKSYTFSFLGNHYRLRNYYLTTYPSVLQEIVDLLNSWDSGFVITMNNDQESWKAAGRNNYHSNMFNFINNEGAEIECLFKGGIDGDKMAGLWNDNIVNSNLGFECESGVSDSKINESNYYNKNITFNMVIRPKYNRIEYEEVVSRGARNVNGTGVSGVSVRIKNPPTSNQTWYLSIALPFLSLDELGKVRTLDVHSINK